MKVYTQEEFDALPVVGSYKQCPTGDYTQIKRFDGRCSFGERCIFSGRCSFGERCIFGAWCRFGAWCHFGEECRFDIGCSFGERCIFGGWCRFGEKCIFGRWCSFGGECIFGRWCSFEGKHKAKSGYPLLSIAGAGSENRTTYFFNTEDGIIVRSGCFKGTLAEFRKKVRQDCPLGTEVKALQYLGFANIVAATWSPEEIEK